MSEKSSIQNPPELPDSLPVTVLMERRPGVTRWSPVVWQAVGVTVGEGENHGGAEVAVDRGDYLQLKFGGFRVRLHRDEAADYYHNLMSPAPGCYIVAVPETDSEDDMPRPVLVTVSFDEANAYGEGDSAVFHVPLPVELYRWVERFVVTYYEPEEKRKRKLKSAKEQRGFGEQR